MDAGASESERERENENARMARLDALAAENDELRREIERRHRVPKTSGKPRTHAAKLSKETKAVLRELRKERIGMVEAVWAISEALTGLGARLLDIEAEAGHGRWAISEALTRLLEKAGFNAHEAPSGPVEPSEKDCGV